MEYNVHISKLASILFLTVFGYIAFEKQIQQHFSKCESYLRERERERERETVQGERLVCSILSLIHKFLETVLWYNLLLKRQLTTTFVLGWPIALNRDCQKWQIM